jgi:hypothetical protein
LKWTKVGLPLLARYETSYGRADDRRSPNDKEGKMVRLKEVAARRQLSILVASIALLVGLTLGPVDTAFAAAAGPASCMGHEASNLSPPGSSDELPAGMRGFNAFFRENFPGTPSGSFIKTIASLHEGSHEACDEALGG